MDVDIYHLIIDRVLPSCRSLLTLLRLFVQLVRYKVLELGSEALLLFLDWGLRDMTRLCTMFHICVHSSATVTISCTQLGLHLDIFDLHSSQSRRHLLELVALDPQLHRELVTLEIQLS